MYSRAEKAAPDQPTTGCRGGGDAEDVVDLVDDHVPDQVDDEVLQQAPVHHLKLPALLTGLSGSGASQHSTQKEADNKHRLDHDPGAKSLQL